MLGQEMAIEIKATASVDARDLKGLSALKSEGQIRRYYLVSRDPVQRAGVARALAGTLKVVPEPSTSYFGQLFEQRVIQEIVHRNLTLELDLQLGYLRTEKAAEIDLIVQRPSGRKQLVEIKSTEHVREKAVRHLRAFEALFPKADLVLLSRDRKRQKLGNIRALPWQEGIVEIAS